MEENPKWELEGIYADEGVSVGSMHKQAQFSRMMEDCRCGKIGLILISDKNACILSEARRFASLKIASPTRLCCYQKMKVFL